MRKRKKNVNQPDLPDDDKPKWNADAGSLCWRGRLVLRLAPQAHAERDLLGEFQKRKWRFVVKNPLPRDKTGIGDDETTSRRNAVRNLMRHQGDRRVIQFVSILDGFVAWFPAEWLAE